MTIAELFVKIGVKGGEESKKAIGGIQGALKSLADTSLEAKAALIGTVYALEKLMTGAAQRGMDLQKFSNLTGLSTEALQRWQFAARQSGVANEDMAGGITAVQKAMGDMLTGKGAPAGFSIFAGATKFDMNRVRDTFYVMEKLKEFSKIAPPELAQSVIGSFGISNDVIQFMRSTQLDISKIKPTAIYGPEEIERLAKINVGWMNLRQTFDTFMGHETAKFGLPIVRHLQGALDVVIRLGQGLENLMIKFPALADAAKVAIMGIGIALMVFGGPLTALSAAITGIIYLMGEWDKHSKGEKSFFGSEEQKKTIKESSPSDILKNHKMDFLSVMMGDLAEGLGSVFTSGMGLGMGGPGNTGILPNPPSNVGTAKTNNVSINQNLNFQHDGKNSKQVAADSHKAIQQAARQIPVQGN